jgi:DUF971 family protein
MRLTVKPCNSQPVEIKHHQLSNRLEISFDDGSVFMLPSPYLRVYTQSAEAVGHAAGQEVLQVAKENVTITDIKPIGHYAICPTFSDGHNSGIYTWDFLYLLGSEYEALWADYLRRLAAAANQAGAPSCPHSH